MFKRLAAFWDRTSTYLNRRVYYAMFGIAITFMCSFFFPLLFIVAQIGIAVLVVCLATDLLFLFLRGRAISSERLIPDRLSNGDDNPILLRVKNDYGFTIHARVLEELPFQLQERNWFRDIVIKQGETIELDYFVHPKERGEYDFGATVVFVDGPLRLAKRRFSIGGDQVVKVYPSFVQMRRYQLNATTQIQEAGVKRMRRLGHSMEFEQIKEYVPGDDYRTINWKATARRGDMMVNNYTDEKSQQIYCLVNKGRVMKLAFEGMTLLDYAINASLVLANTALLKQDRAGLITFAQSVDSFIVADRKPVQLNHILEALYKQKTNFLEPDFERLFSIVRHRVTNRSLLILFTNFESIESLERELPSLKKLAHYHLLMVVFFENTELRTLITNEAKSTEDIYIKTIAEKFRYEKQLMVKELQKNGIIAVLSSPQQLTVNALNKYLELKKRQAI